MRTASLRIFRVGEDQWDRFVWDQFVWDQLVLSCVHFNGNRATVEKHV